MSMRDKNMNSAFGNPSSFIQIWLRELLANKPEMKFIDSSWIRGVHIELSEFGVVNLITVEISMPSNAKAPFNFQNADIQTKIKNGKIENHKIFIQVKFK